MTATIFRGNKAGAFTIAEVNAGLAAGTWPRAHGDETAFRARHFSFRMPLRVAYAEGGGGEPAGYIMRTWAIPFRRPGTDELWVFALDMHHGSNGTVEYGTWGRALAYKIAYDPLADLWSVTRNTNLYGEFLTSNNHVFHSVPTVRAADLGSGVLLSWSGNTRLRTTGVDQGTNSGACYIAYGDAAMGAVTTSQAGSFHRGWSGTTYWNQMTLDRGIDGSAAYPAGDFRWTARLHTGNGNIYVDPMINQSLNTWSTTNGKPWNPAGYSFGGVGIDGAMTCFTYAHATTGQKDRHLWFYVTSSGQLAVTLFHWNLTDTTANTPNNWTQRFNTVLDTLGGGNGGFDLRGVQKLSDTLYLYNYRGRFGYVKLNMTQGSEGVVSAGRISPVELASNDLAADALTPAIATEHDPSTFWYMSKAGTAKTDYQLRMMTLSGGDLVDAGVGYGFPDLAWLPNTLSSANLAGIAYGATSSHLWWHGFTDPANARGIHLHIRSQFGHTGLFLRMMSLVDGVVGFDGQEHHLANYAGVSQWHNNQSSPSVPSWLRRIGTTPAYVCCLPDGQLVCFTLQQPLS